MFVIFPKGDKLVRATELAKLLTLEKSMKGALTLVTRLKHPVLQEKFSSILEVKAFLSMLISKLLPILPYTRIY
jgi:hypothetical protein